MYYVLLIDDELYIQDLLSRIIKNNTSCEIITASHGLEALDQLRSQPVDLILLDLNMPTMDGFELLSVLNEDPQLNTIPVYIISAMHSDDMKQHCLQYGAKGFFSKIELVTRGPEQDKLITLLKENEYCKVKSSC